MLVKYIDKICRQLDILILYESRFGIKSLGKPGVSEVIEYLPADDIINISAKTMLIGPDNLRDRFTLLGTPINKSPYLELVKALSNSGNLSNTEYIIRLSKGCLDNRKPLSINEAYYDKILHRYENSKEFLLSGSIKPLKVIKFNSNSYVFDGKHRAALYCLFDLPAKAIDITPHLRDSYLYKLSQKMMKKEKYYRKHIAFYDKLFNARH